MAYRDIEAVKVGDKAAVMYFGAYADMANVPKTNLINGASYVCTDSSNVGKVYLFSEEDNGWNLAFTLGS